MQRVREYYLVYYTEICRTELIHVLKECVEEKIGGQLMEE